MQPDKRHIENGLEIPSEGYCDQPYAAQNADGSWTIVMTTGRGQEGDTGQHVVAYITPDRGQSWEGPFDIEPATGPEASWVMPLRVPETGRIYAFYTFNKANQREVACVDGSTFSRVDSFGVYAYRYSDDGGRSWSGERYEIPMRKFACDLNNTYGGKVQFFWGVGKPFLHKGAAYVCASKVGGFGQGFFVQNEGVLFRCANLLTETDPSRHVWETLPDGDVGIRTPPGGGPIAGEFNATPMHDGSLYGAFRTIDGWVGRAISRDDGYRWDIDWMRYAPGGRRVKNPRSATFVRRFSNGKYIHWICFHGGARLAAHPDVASWAAYGNRNPIWLTGGIERDGDIVWSEPEIILYDDKLGNRMSYPDFIEEAGRYYMTETQKTTARIHELDPALLEGMWAQRETAVVTRSGLVAEWDGVAAHLRLPALPYLHNRNPIRTAESVADDGSRLVVPERGGLTLDCRVRFDDLEAWQILFDSRTPEGDGLLLQLTDRGTLCLHLIGRLYDEPGAVIGNAMTDSAWECDLGLLRAGQTHHVTFIVDGGPKLITVLVDGVLCDGGDEKQFGWGRFHPCLRDVNGAAEARLAPTLHGALLSLRVYARYLRTSEAVANYRAEAE